MTTMRRKQRRVVYEDLPEAPAQQPIIEIYRLPIIYTIYYILDVLKRCLAFLMSFIQKKEDPKERELVNAAWGENQKYLRRSVQKSVEDETPPVLTPEVDFKDDPSVQPERQPFTSRFQSGQDVVAGSQPQTPTSRCESQCSSKVSAPLSWTATAKEDIIVIYPVAPIPKYTY